MRSLLLWPISFCIFGMCSPWRKSAATVWTVYLLLMILMLLPTLFSFADFLHSNWMSSHPSGFSLFSLDNEDSFRIPSHWRMLSLILINLLCSHWRWVTTLGRWVAKLERWMANSGRWVAKLGRRVANSGRWVAKSGRWVAQSGRWVAKFVAHPCLLRQLGANPDISQKY